MSAAKDRLRLVVDAIEHPTPQEPLSPALEEALVKTALSPRGPIAGDPALARAYRRREPTSRLARREKERQLRPPRRLAVPGLHPDPSLFFAPQRPPSRRLPALVCQSCGAQDPAEVCCAAPDWQPATPSLRSPS